MFDLIKPKTAWRWGSKETAAFMAVREALCNEPSVSTLDWNEQFSLQTDPTTETGKGCALTQRMTKTMPDGTTKKVEKMIADASKKLMDAECDVWEAYAIVCGITHFHLYVSQGSFSVETDHQSLK